MNHKFRDFGTMGLVGRCVAVEMQTTGDFVTDPCNPEQTSAGGEAW